MAKLTIPELAREGNRYLTGKRVGACSECGNEGRYIITLADNHPQWIKDVVYSAHGHEELLPDDYRYSWVAEILTYLAESYMSELDEIGHEWADSSTDIYTRDLLDWAGSRLSRVEYCDEAASEFGPADSVFNSLQRGQYLERCEVFDLVRVALEKELETREETDDAKV